MAWLATTSPKHKRSVRLTTTRYEGYLGIIEELGALGWQRPFSLTIFLVELAGPHFVVRPFSEAPPRPNQPGCLSSCLRGRPNL